MNNATVHGNLTSDMTLRFANSGTAVVNFLLADNYKRGDEEKVTFIDCTAFSSLAENLAESVGRGDRLLVCGRYETQTWEKDGETRSKQVLVVDEAAVSLRFATAAVTKNERPS